MPPNRIQFFCFCICFHQKAPTSEVGSPNGLVPPNGKSWICHCNMLFSQPTTPIICRNVTYLPIWIPFKSDSLPTSSLSFSLAPGPTFQTATTLNSENLRQHFQAPSIQPSPGIPSPFPVISPIDTSVPPPPIIFSQTLSPIHPEGAPHTSIPPQPNVSCQVQIHLKSPDIAPTDSKHPLCFTAAAQVFRMPSQFVYDEKTLPEPRVITRQYLDSLPKLSPEELQIPSVGSAIIQM